MLVAAVAPHTLGAQVDPRGKVRSLRTEHFRVHYPVALDSLARRAAVLAEDAWRNLATELVTPAVPVELLIQDNVDLSNGFAQVFPTNRITIYALPPIALAELRNHDDWLRLVITHELTHIFHIDRARGMWRLGRAVFGRNQALFPNSLLPSWVKEGIAVHYESKFTGSGRIVSTESRVVETAAAIADDMPGPDAWSAATTEYPRGNMPYSWGAQLMHRQAVQGGDSSMRRFVEQTALFPIPFTLNRSAKLAFGHTFFGSSAALRDSLQRANAPSASAPQANTQQTNTPRVNAQQFDAQLATIPGVSEDSAWQRVVPGTASGNWNLAYPRWRSDDTLEWVASNGRDVTGVYRTMAPPPDTPDSALVAPSRIARRNSLDVNAVGPHGTSIFSQYDYVDPYTLRSDLYARDSTGERRLTHNARLIQPDVRERDGAIIAVQLTPGGSRIVRLAGDSIVPLTQAGNAEWAEPRWNPTFQDIVAVQLLRTGVQRIVLLDTLGNIARIIAESRAVMATPAFVPNAVAVIWASDRSGRMQLETADITQAYTRTNIRFFDNNVQAGVISLQSVPYTDTLWRADVHAASNVSTAVYQPSVSPDGTRVAALIYRDNGYMLAVAPYAGDGPPVRDTWYRATRVVATSDSVFTGPSFAYRPLRQLIPRYWQPVIGQARDGGSLFGASTSSEDIVGRHSYSASALVNPRNGELNGGAAYRYAGLGQPVVDVSVSQDWDATFRMTDTVGTTLGLLARRKQFATVALGWSVPRVRWSASYAIGAQYEWRHFASETDSILGAVGSVYRTGTRYPSLFVSGGVGTLARGARAFSAEQGISASGTVSVRRREGLANSESWRGVGVVRGFVPLPLPGFARHVLGARIAGGATDTRAASEFDVGGVSGVLTEIIPGVSIGDPSRTFPVRGFAPGAQRGMRALSASAEYRAPLGVLARGMGLLPLFLDRFSLSTFADAGRAWCPSNSAQRVAALCESPNVRGGWLASAGTELNVDLALQYDVPYRLRIGVAKPFAAPRELSRRTAFYVTLGAYF